VRRYTTSVLGGIALLLAVSLLAAACGGGAESATTAPPQEQEQPTAEGQPAASEGRSLLMGRCTVCHGLARVEQVGRTGEEWAATVARMVGYGADLSAEEQETLVQYLAETYSPHR